MKKLDTLKHHYGPEFEKLVMWSIMTDTNFGENAFSSVDGMIFENIDYRRIFAVGKESWVSNASYGGFVALFSELRQQVLAASNDKQKAELLATLKVLMKVRKTKVNPAAAIYVQKTFGRFIVKANLRDALLRSPALWEEGKFDEVLSLVDEAISSQQTTSDQDLGIDWSDPVAKLAVYTKKHIASFHAPIGLALLDSKLRGGLEPGTLGIVMGPAKRGKSQFLTQAACVPIQRGLNAAIVSLELRAIDYAERCDAHMTGIAINSLVKYRKKHRGRIVRHTLATKGKLMIKHWGTNSATVNDIVHWLKALKSQKGFEPNVLIVDYADLLRPLGRHNEVRFGLEEIIKSLRALAAQFDCAVWTASQSNKSTFKSQMISLGDVSESISKMQVADVVIGMAQTEGERVKNKMRLLLLANRLGGEEGTVVDCISNTATMSLRQSAQQLSQNQIVVP